MHLEATTILAYRNENKSVIGGDGQVSFGDTILKANATKVRKLHNGKVLAGFAGSTADAFSLFDMFEEKIKEKNGDLLKSAIEFSKSWRKDKYLKKLEAMMIVLDLNHIFILTGNGDVVEPQDGVLASIGSGSNYAISSARALKQHTKLDGEILVRDSLKIASDICVYTNDNITLLTIEKDENE